MPISAQPCIYDKQSGSIMFPVPTNTGDTITYTSSTATGMSTANRAHDEKIKNMERIPEHHAGS